MPEGRERLGVAAAVLAALLLSGCAGGSSSSGNPLAPTGAPKTAKPASLNACVLLGQAQASQVIGTDLTMLTDQAAGLAGTCAYASASAGASIVISVSQAPSDLLGQATIKQALLSKGGFQSLTGIGDVAGEAKDSHSVTIAFVKGQEFVVLGATSPIASGAELAPKLESVAKSIAGQL
jgi:hypothetical protein